MSAQWLGSGFCPSIDPSLQSIDRSESALRFIKGLQTPVSVRLIIV